MKTKEELKKELAELKLKHKIVFSIEPFLNDEETEVATIYLRKPDRITHALVSKLIMGNDPFKAIEAALKNLYIGGDALELVVENEDALLSCESAVVEMLQKKTAALKKN